MNLAPTSPTPFEAGDVVLCINKKTSRNIDTEARITVGRSYTVLASHHMTRPGAGMIKIVNDRGRITWYCWKFFKHALTARFQEEMRRVP